MQLMSKRWTHLAVFAIATVLAAIPITLGWTSGGEAGNSGGPANFSTNCTSCHQYNMGTGRVELLGVPRRYRAGEVYDLTIHVDAPDQDGAGFEVSAEGPGGHKGTLLLTDMVNTQFADFPGDDYVTHTAAGFGDSELNWVAGGGSYDYHLQWVAPSSDVGPVTFYAAVNAVDDDFPGFNGVRYYAANATSAYAEPGDVDGDRDIDLGDHRRLTECLSGPDAPFGEGCDHADVDGDGDVDLVDISAGQSAFTGPTANDPAEYVLADVVRGGVLYDKWWKVIDAAEPAGNHPLYPVIGGKSGSTTYRCKECHGWDYKGRDGAYAVGSSHYTDIAGVQNTLLTPQEVFDLLKSPDTGGGGHSMAAYGMSDGDLWDVVKMTLEGVIETDDFIDVNGAFLGEAEPTGMDIYGLACASCHGPEGRHLVFHGTEVIGSVATGNPWEFLHKVRFGHAGSPMPSFELLGWSVQWAADVGAHSANLPQTP